MSRKKSAATVLAETFGWDVAEVRECRYQPGHTRQPLYTVGDEYFAVGQRRPADPYKWYPYKDQFFATNAGTVVWVAKADAAIETAYAVQKDAPVRRQRRAADELPESDVLYGESPDY